MTQPRIINLFPTPVLSTDLGREFTKEELEFVNQNKSKIVGNLGNDKSVDTYVLDRPELASIKKFIEDQVAQYLIIVEQPINPTALRVTQSWINYSGNRDGHHLHRHVNSYVSGVLYINTTPEDKIHFYKNDYQQITLSRSAINQWTSPSWWLEAEKSRLYIFPSSLTHGVEALDRDSVRISLAFNTFPVGVIGNTDAVTELALL